MAVSSRALFNLVEEQRIYEEQGLEKYVEYQQKNENVILKPGPAFYFVKVARGGPERAAWRGGRGCGVRRGAEDAARPDFGKRRSPKPPSPEIVLPRGDVFGSVPNSSRQGSLESSPVSFCAPWPRGRRFSPLSHSLSIPPALSSRY